jgi:hypothetical protein
MEKLLDEFLNFRGRDHSCYLLVLHKFFAYANGLLEFYELHFYPSLFLLHSTGGLSPSQLAPLPHFDHLLTRLVSPPTKTATWR